MTSSYSLWSVQSKGARVGKLACIGDSQKYVGYAVLSGHIRSIGVFIVRPKRKRMGSYDNYVEVDVVAQPRLEGREESLPILPSPTGLRWETLVPVQFALQHQPDLLEGWNGRLWGCTRLITSADVRRMEAEREAEVARFAQG